MKRKQIIAACLCAALAGLPMAGAADAAARQQDLDTLLSTLTEHHADFYRNTTAQTVADKKTAIEAGLDTMSDLDFAVSLSELTALAGDSHTMLSVGSALPDAHLLPLQLEWMDGGWTVLGLPAADRNALGGTLLSLAGHSMDELLDALSPMIAHDNEVYLRRQFGGMVYVPELLAHYGLITSTERALPAVVRCTDGREVTLSLPVLSRQDFTALGDKGFISAERLRTAVPPTETTNVYYQSLDLGGGALYVQYNRCAEDPDRPMQAFADEIGAKLESGAYSKLLIDLRHNGGGSDGVLHPVIYQAQQFIARGGAAYVLAGEQTFSSALINTVHLKDVDAVFVGTPTGGSVDHFGAVTGFTLPQTGIRGQYSNKFIDLGTLFEAAKPYGVESFRPDVTVEQTYADYVNGVDTAVQYILSHPPMTVTQTATAKPSAAKVTVNGVPFAAAAYKLAGSNYFKLRDLAAAFAGTDAAFQVSWRADAQRVELSDGAYTPVGGELSPLPAGERTARRATADVYAGGRPLVGRAYTIDGNHYFKLRDLCAALGVSVDWDEAAQTIRIDTTQPYLAA